MFTQVYGNEILTNESMRSNKLIEYTSFATQYVNNTGGISNLGKIYDFNNPILMPVGNRIVQITGKVMTENQEVIFKLGDAALKP